MNKEIFVPIIGFEDRYKVSNTGKVFSIKSNRYIKSFISRIGYHDVYLKVNKKTTVKKLHRLVAEAFIENLNNFKEVNHIDGNKSNNNVSNLEWTSRSNNMKHCFKLGLKKAKKGEENNKAKLKIEDIKNIRLYRKNGETLQSISKKFNVSIANIHAICNNLTWKHT